MQVPFSPRRARPLRTHLLVVAVGALLPMALFAAFVAVRTRPGGARAREAHPRARVRRVPR